MAKGHRVQRLAPIPWNSYFEAAKLKWSPRRRTQHLLEAHAVQHDTLPHSGYAAICRREGHQLFGWSLSSIALVPCLIRVLRNTHLTYRVLYLPAGCTFPMKKK